MAIDPTVVGHIFAGNYAGAARALISSGSNAINGNTPQVRQEIARILLQRGNVAPAALEEMVGQTVARIQFVQQLARNIGRAGSGALAVAPSTQRKHGGR